MAPIALQMLWSYYHNSLIYPDLDFVLWYFLGPFKKLVCIGYFILALCLGLYMSHLYLVDITQLMALSSRGMHTVI